MMPDINAVATAVRVWLEAAARMGVERDVLDLDGRLFELRRGGERRVLLSGVSPLNTAMAVRLAADKYASVLLLERAGVRVPKTVRCVSRLGDSSAADAGKEHADRVGYPVIVKPNTSTGARGVQVVEDRGRLATTLRETWTIDPIALVQESIDGRDYRLDFLDDAFLIGFERRPLRVRGDGKRSLADLFVEQDPRLADPARRRRLTEDPRCRDALDKRGWTLSTVLKEGAALSFDGPIQSLAGVSTARLVHSVPEALRALCARIGRELGLRHFGVDLKVETLEGDPSAATVVGVNGSPLLSQTYLLGHKEQVIAAHMRLIEAIFSSR
jgi:glutathione synthase/RimK-type ligase-like ATP-grasp enzyme